MKSSSDYFQDDLAVGHAVEELILKKIQRKYPKSYRKKGKNKGFDLVIKELDQTVEVKQDFKGKHTGNIVVEIEYGDEPSGLSVTTANFWAITDGYFIYWITPDNIRRCIEENDLIYTGWVGPGDTKYKKAYLIERDELLGYCKQPIVKLKEDDPLYRENFIKRKDNHVYE